MAKWGVFDLSGKVALITGASRGLGRSDPSGIEQLAEEV